MPSASTTVYGYGTRFLLACVLVALVKGEGRTPLGGGGVVTPVVEEPRVRTRLHKRNRGSLIWVHLSGLGVVGCLPRGASKASAEGEEQEEAHEEHSKEHEKHASAIEPGGVAPSSASAALKMCVRPYI